MKIKNVRKLVAAGVGFILLAVSNFTDVVTADTLFGIPADMLVNGVISVLAMLGIYQVQNEPLPAPEEEE